MHEIDGVDTQPREVISIYLRPDSQESSPSREELRESRERLERAIFGTPISRRAARALSVGRLVSGSFAPSR